VSGLTKLFVVLVTVLSVMLVAVVVPFVANTQNYRELLTAANQRAQTAEQSAQHAETQRRLAEDRAGEAGRQQTEGRRDLEGRITAMSTELAAARSAQRALETENAQLRASVENFGAAVKQYAVITEGLKVELDGRREELLRQQTRNIQMEDRNRDLDSQLQTINSQLRRTREMITQLEERNREMETKLAMVPEDVRVRIGTSTAETTSPIIPATPIRGSVVAVEQVGDHVFVRVNVGTNDGVQPNMKFWVHRNNQFLGTLVITRADQTDSAGRMDIREGTVARGDAILTGAGL
jgi:hypothetical protein